MPASAADVRASLTALTDVAYRKVEAIVRSAKSGDAAVAALLEAVPTVVDVYGESAASMAADWYDELRDVAGVAGGFTAEPTFVEPAAGKVEAAVRWGMSPLFQAEPDPEAAARRVGDRVGAWVVDSHRATIVDSVAADRHALGWQRHARPAACGFCRMLEGRGAVYRKGTARFASHGHCFCTASVVFDTGESGIEASTMQYRASAKTQTDADRARVRDWVAANQ